MAVDACSPYPRAAHVARAEGFNDGSFAARTIARLANVIEDAQRSVKPRDAGLMASSAEWMRSFTRDNFHLEPEAFTARLQELGFLGQDAKLNPELLKTLLDEDTKWPLYVAATSRYLQATGAGLQESAMACLLYTSDAADE